MATLRLPPYSGYERPNFTVPPNGATPSSGNLQIRPDFVRPGVDTPDPNRPVGNAEFNRARPVGGNYTPQPAAAPAPGQNVTDARMSRPPVGRLARMGRTALRGGGTFGAASMALGLLPESVQNATVDFDVAEGGAAENLARRFEKTGLTRVQTPEERRAARDPAFARGQETLRRTGVTPDPAAGAGRGIGVSAPAPQSFDRTDDVRSSIDTGVIPETLRDGRIWRSGNSYTGMDVKDGAAFVDARTGMNRESGGTVNTMPSLANGMSSALSSELAAARRAAADRGDIEGALRSFGGPGTQQPQQRTPAQEAMDTIQEMRNRGLRVTGTMYRSLVNDITQQRGNESRDQTTRRGQDMDSADRRLTREAEAMRGDRDFGLRLSTEQRQARESGDKEVIDRVTSMLPLTGNPEVDGPMKANALRTLNLQFGMEVNRLREYVQQNPSDADAIRQLQFLQTRGLSAMAGNEESLLRSVLGAEARRISQNDDGMRLNPFAGRDSGSNTPMTRVIKEEDSLLPFHDGYVHFEDAAGNANRVRRSQVDPDTVQLLRN